jgi:hypothetical protein
MQIDDFSNTLNGLASSFGLGLKADRLNSYYEVFQDISEKDWIAICQRSKMNADRFPTIKDLCTIAYDMGAFATRRNSSDWLSFDCSCGNSFVFNIKQAKQHPEGVVKCIGAFYGECNRGYALGFLMKNWNGINHVPVCDNCGDRHFPNVDCVETQVALQWVKSAFHTAQNA